MNNIKNNILDISHNYYKYLMNLHNVNGVGLGFKKINQTWTKELCIHVLVKEKLEEKYLTKNSVIPKTYMGIRTDVIEIGSFFLNANKGINYDFKLRPLQGGCAISIRYLNENGKMKTSTGTLGCIVSKNKKLLGKDYFILSNNHVIANFNKASIGTSILQPQYNSGNYETVATLSDFIMLRYSGLFEEELNEVDAAIAKITNKSLISNKIFGIGTIKGVNKPTLGLNVKKSGAATGLTKGKITTIGLTQEIHANGEVLMFKDTLLSDMHNKSGDSGSCVLNDNNEIIGMIYGVNGEGFSTIHDINVILKKFKVDVYTG